MPEQFAAAHPLRRSPRSGRLRARCLGAISAMLVAALAATSCSSGSSASSSSATGSSGATTTATGTPYVIGTIASETGTYASSIGGTFATVDAWTKWTNAHGGISGHPVKVITEDDGGVPANGITAAKTLIADKVQAIVGPASNTEASWYQLVGAANIATLGGQTNGQALYQLAPLLFPTGTTSPFGVLNIAAKQGKTSFGVMYCAEVPACASQVTLLKSIQSSDAKDLGRLKITYSGSVAYAAPNYTAQCLAAKQDGVNSLYVSDSAAVAVRVEQDCASQGYNPLPVGYGASADNSWLSEPSLNGAYVVEEDFPWFGTTTTVEKDFHAALQNYDPSLLTAATTFNANVSQVWASLQVYKAIVEQEHVAPTASSKELISAIYKLPAGWSLPDVTPPLTFGGPGRPNPQIPCYFVAQVKGGQWTSPSSGYTCPQ
jgi:branched-chain amino acid transport system substrate-binding protein